ncbi:MAG: hypothetical protein KKC99_10010 [Proteobacteria bacterium]|nr:hypothetical protein [Pseudomonadota bacterium]
MKRQTFSMIVSIVILLSVSMTHLAWANCGGGGVGPFSFAIKRDCQEYVNTLKEYLRMLFEARDALHAKHKPSKEDFEAFLKLEDQFDQYATAAQNYMAEKLKEAKNDGSLEGKMYLEQQLRRIQNVLENKHKAVWDTFVWAQDELEIRKRD